MRPDERALKELVDRSIPTPSDREMESRCDRVLQKLQSGNMATLESARLQPERIPSWQTPWRVAVVGAAIAATLVVALSPAIWKTDDMKPAPPTAKGEAPRDVEPLRTIGENSTAKSLSDGSRIEMRAGAEAVVEDVPDGLMVRLNAGSILVFAVKQVPGRHLYVQTRDLKVSVVGTVFLVDADNNGSRVAVLEGEVRVKQGDVEERLRPGQQFPSLPQSEDLAFFRATGWSREAAAYLAKMHEELAQRLAARQSSGRPASISDKPRFEEASIRLCEQDIQTPQGARGGGSNSFRVSPGRIDAVCMTLPSLIKIAYRPLDNNPASPGTPSALQIRQMNVTYGLGGEDGTRVRGGPDWVRSERYTIAAVADGSTDAVTLQRPMLLDLLERRFQLRLRVETEEAPVYALTIAKSGLKLKPAEPGSCEVVPPDSAAPVSDPEATRRFLEAMRQGGPPRCGVAALGNGPNMMITGGRMPLRVIADMLSTNANSRGRLSYTLPLNGHVVVDKTGSPDTDLFNYVLEFVNDETLDRALPPASNVPIAPSVFDAVEKLGLRLERSKALREFIFIEHAERP
jgi:uncharacterized protein (TIGR03435 family)